jgi:hypothetical protein
VRAYLSVGHRDSPEVGCPSAALLEEIARCADVTKRAYTDGVVAVIDDDAALLAPHIENVLTLLGVEGQR